MASDWIDRLVDDLCDELGIKTDKERRWVEMIIRSHVPDGTLQEIERQLEAKP